jgi:molybdate transport system substrate-binding protein
MRVFRTVLTAAFAIALSHGAAVAAEIKVVSVGALQVVLPKLAADYTKATGNTVTFTFTNPAMLAATLAGAKFDAMVVPASSAEDLDKAGQLAAGTHIRVARGGVGVAIREGAPKPDLSTPDAFKKYVLAAKNVVYTDPTTLNGSGVLTQRILTEAGLWDAVKAKGLQSNLAGGKELIAKGEYQIAFFNLAETAAPGVVVGGPVPAPYQQYTNYDAATFGDAVTKEEASAFVKFISAPASAAIWKVAWLEPTAPR